MSGRTGYIPDKYDKRDQEYKIDPTVVLPEAATLLSSNSQWLLPIYDQQQTDSCVANAVAAAIRYTARYMIAKQKGDAEALAPALDPSRLFIYYNSRAMPKMTRYNLGNPDWPADVGAGGTDIRFALRTINKWGVCGEKSWSWKTEQDSETPLRLKDRPTGAAYKAAYALHAVTYSRLDLDSKIAKGEEASVTLPEKEVMGNNTLRKLKQCLNEGFPVVFGFEMYSKTTLWDKSTTPWTYPPLPGPKEERNSTGGHAVLAIGYDDTTKAILCQNSWGTKLSNDVLSEPSYTMNVNDKIDSERFWMPYEWITDWQATDDFWTLRFLEVNDKPPPNKATWTFSTLTTPSQPTIACTPSSVIATRGGAPGGDLSAIYWIATDGSVQVCLVNFITTVGGTPTFQSSGPAVPKGLASPGGLACVYPQKGQARVFFIAPDKTIKSWGWGYGGVSGWSALSAGTGAIEATEGGSITAVCRSSAAVDIWWRSPRGVLTTMLQSNDSGSFSVNAASYGSNASTGLTSISSAADMLGVWWNTTEGACTGLIASGSSGSSGPSWRVPFSQPDADNIIPQEARLASASSGPNNVNIFHVTAGGRIKIYYGAREGTGSPFEWESVVPNDAHFDARVDCGVTAIASGPGLVNVAWVAPNYSLCGASIYASDSKPRWRTYTITAASSVADGSPLGSYRQTDRQDFGVVYVDDSQMVKVAYCCNPY